MGVARLQDKYNKEIRPELEKQLGRENPMSLPRLNKIVVNMGVGSAITEKKHIEECVSSLSLITGQRPMVTTARKSIAGFKLREGMAIGCKVTLRGRRMYEFMDSLISVAIPRVRDFRGLNPTGFDGNGNYTMGLSEQLVFPELNPDKFLRQQGMNITFVTTTKSNEEAKLLLDLFGLPYKDKEKHEAGAA